MSAVSKPPIAAGYYIIVQTLSKEIISMFSIEKVLRHTSSFTTLNFQFYEALQFGQSGFIEKRKLCHKIAESLSV